MHIIVCVCVYTYMCTCMGECGGVHAYNCVCGWVGGVAFLKNGMVLGKIPPYRT